MTRRLQKQENAGLGRETHGQDAHATGTAPLGLGRFSCARLFVVVMVPLVVDFLLEKGHVLLPDHPGLGLDVNEDALKEYRVQA